MHRYMYDVHLPARCFHYAYAADNYDWIAADERRRQDVLWRPGDGAEMLPWESSVW